MANRDHELIIYKVGQTFVCEYQTLLINENGFNMTPDGHLTADSFDEIVEKIKEIGYDQIIENS